MRFLGSITALVLALIVAWQPAARAEQLDRYRIGYEILLAGFSVGNIEVAVELSKNEYHVIADTRNSGLLRLLAGFTSRAESSGRTSLGELRQLSHRADNVWVGEKRYVRNAYRDDGGVSVEVLPSAAADGRDQVPEHQRADTIDPLSAGLQASLRAAGARACQGSLAVFDGRRRYDLHFRPVGEEEVSGPFYSGPALHCHIDLERINGFSRDPWLPRAKSSDAAEIWFAPVAANLPPLPTRMMTDLGLGTAEVILVSLIVAPAAPHDHQARPSASTKSGAESAGQASPSEGDVGDALTQLLESRSNP